MHLFTLFRVIVAFLAAFSAARAANIVWVSDAPAGGGPSFPVEDSTYADHGWVALLQSAGHSVTRYNPPDAATTLLPAEHIAALNTNDLIIISRCISSAAFLTPQVTNWNVDITKPLLTVNSYLARAIRLGWFTGSTLPDDTPTPLTAVDLTDPRIDYIFSCLTLNSNTTAEVYDEAIDRNTSHIVEPPVAGGITLATATFVPLLGSTSTTTIAIAEWPTGTPVRGGADILGGYRMFFAGGSRETNGANIPANTGKENLTIAGEGMFLRTVEIAISGGISPVPSNAPISISSHPQSTAVYEGAPAALRVCAVGTRPRTFQWQRDNGAGSFTNIPGAVNPVYTIATATPAHAGDYRVVAANNFATVTSSVATLTVNMPALGIRILAYTSDVGAQLAVNSPVPGGLIVFEGSANLTDWTIVGTATNSPSGTTFFTDVTFAAARYYRARDGGSGVYSSNAVGYLQLVLSPGYTMIANPFLNTNNTVASILPSFAAGGSLFKLGAGGRFYVNNFLDGWSDTNMTLVPGEGAFIYNPGNVSRVATLKGGIVQGITTNFLPTGLFICSSIVPLSGGINSALNFPTFHGVQIYRFNPGSGSYLVDSYSQDFGWEGASGGAEPVINVGQSFWVNSPIAGPWIRAFDAGGEATTYAVSQVASTSTVAQVNFFTYNVNTAFGLVSNHVGNPVTGNFVGQLYASTTSNDENSLIAIGSPMPFGGPGPSAGYVRPSKTLDLLWALDPGSRPYLPAPPGDNNQRGMAYNPATGHVLLVSRTGGLSVQVLDANTGTDVGTLNVSGISGGTFPLNQIGVADDGTIYAANLKNTTSDGDFRIYRWDNEAATPTIAFSGILATNGSRWGDKMDIRGSGNGVQLLFSQGGFGVGNRIALFTNFNGALTPTVMSVSGITDGDTAGGLAFAEGNRCYIKGPGAAFRYCAFDLATASASVLASPAIPASIANAVLGSFPAAKFLAVMQVSSLTSNKNIFLCDISTPDAPQILDSKPFVIPGVNNINVAGAIDFSPTAMFGLNANNGLRAWRVAPGDPLVTIPGATPGQTIYLQLRVWEANRGTTYEAAVANQSEFGKSSVFSVAAGGGLGPLPPDANTFASFGLSAPPNITAHPQNATVNEGGTTNFSVTATGSSLSYRWYFNGILIPGATNSVRTIPNAQCANAGSYFVVVSNSFGVATSAVATLTVRDITPPAISCPANITVTSSGGSVPVFYNPTATDTCTTPTLSCVPPSGSSFAPGTTSVTCQARDDATNISSCSFTVTVATAPAITVQPQSQTVNVGSTVVFSVGAGGTSPLRYRWYFNGAAISNGVSSNYVILNVQLAHAGDYFAVVTNDYGAVTSSVAVLTVGESDSDGDGMPDSWEVTYGFQPNNPADAATDADGDGMTNLEEYRADTNPLNGSSVLVLTSISSSSGSVTIAFASQAGLTYWVESKNLRSDLSWTVLAQIVGSGTTTSFVDPDANSFSRYYRVGASRSGTAPDVYSVNTVGYVHISIAQSTNTVTRPLLATPINTLDYLIPNPPLGTCVYKWLPQLQGYTVSCYEDGFWFPDNFSLLPGETFLVNSPSPFTLTFVGEVIPATAPMITTQPLSQWVEPGDSAELSVSVDGAAPFSYQWFFNATAIPNATGAMLAISDAQLASAGNYHVVVSNSAGSVTSAVAILSVGTALPEIALLHVPTSPWNYLADASDQGTAWTEPGFNDATWSSGFGLFGFEESTPLPYVIQTPIPPPGSGGPITVYYRARFQWSYSPIAVTLTASNYIDDGAVFYVNGQEVARLRVPLGHNYLTPAGNHEAALEVITLTPTNLVVGENVLAVEVHQASGINSDGVFGMGLTATLPARPRISVAHEPSNRTVLEGRSSTLTVYVAAVPAPHFQWYKDGMLIPGATNQSFVIASMTPADAGSYFCRVTNAFGSVDSRTALVNFDPDLAPPLLVRALAAANLTTLTVSFSEPLDPASATESFNYHVQSADGTQILSIMVGSPMLANSTNVILTLADPRTPGVNYILTIIGNVADLYGNPITSNPQIPILNETTLVGINEQAIWRYHDRGIDVGAAWMNPAYDDSSWSNGSPVFDGSRANPLRTIVGGESVRTFLSLNGLSGDTNITFYFRTHFTFAADQFDGILRVRPFVDDGMVLYINGQETLRIGMPAGEITSGVFASRVVNTAAYEGPFELPTSNLVNGVNLLAVEVHQASLTSSDVTFALELIATPGAGGGAPAITLHPQSQTNFVGGTAQFTVSASAAQPLMYQWFLNGTPIAAQTNATLTRTNLQLSDAGGYHVVVSNAAGSAVSTTATLTLLPCPPTPEGLIAWWKGDGNAIDSLTGQSGVPRNGASFAPGLVGQAFSLDGANDYIEVANEIAPSFPAGAAFSIELWVYRTSDAFPQHLYGKRIGCTGGAGWNYQEAIGDGAMALSDVPANQWTHIATVYTSTEFRRYINGNLVTVVSEPSPPPNSASLLIGGSGSCTTFAGLIDELSFYNRALSSNEIATIYAAGSAGKCLPEAPIVLVNGQVGSTNVVHTNSASVEIRSALPGRVIFFTLDGSDPAGGRFYTGPFALTESAVIRAVAYSADFSSSAEADPVTVTIVNSPNILAQPRAQVVAAGATAQFTVSASGDEPLSYQWFKDGIPIAGGDGPAFIIAAVSPFDAGGYFVRVSNPYGAAFSATVPLTVLAPPMITAQPVSAVGVLPGTNVMFCVEVTGDPVLRFQWRKNGVNISNATNSCLLITNVQVEHGGTYDVLVENSIGVALSDIAILRVSLPFVPAGNNFVDRVLIDGGSGRLRANNTNADKEPNEPNHAGKPGGSSVWYRWTAPFNGIATFSTPGSGFDTLLAAYTGTSVGALTTIAADEDSGGFLTSLIRFQAEAGKEYAIAVDGFDGVEGNFALTWTLEPTAEPLPFIFSQPQSLTVRRGSNAVFTVGVSNAVTLQWFRNGAPLPSATSTQLVVVDVQPEDVAAYRVRVSNAAGQAIESDTAILEIGSLESVRSADKLPDLSIPPPLPGPQAGKANAAAVAAAVVIVNAGGLDAQVLNNTGSTTSVGETNACFRIGGASRWFQVRAGATATMRVDTIGSTIDTLLSIYTGTDPLSLVAVPGGCDDNSGPDGLTSVVKFQAIAGTDYSIQIDGKNGTNGLVFLNWGLGTEPTNNQPVTRPTVRQGDPLTMTCAANGVPEPSFQWLLNSQPLANETNRTITRLNMQPEHAGAYSVIASNFIGAITSTVAVVTVQSNQFSAAQNTFELDSGGWTLFGDATSLAFQPSGGNPGGRIVVGNSFVTGESWYWRAPASFLGNKFHCYDGLLSFDLRQAIAPTQILPQEDVILEGAGLRLVVDRPNVPTTAWVSYKIPLNALGGWRKDSLAGPSPTPEEFIALLSSLTNLLIRGEFSSVPGVGGELDNVFLLAPTTAVLSLQPVADADGWLVEWPVALGNYLLESAASLDGPWELIATPPTTVNNLNRVTLGVETGQRFFRLRRAQ